MQMGLGIGINRIRGGGFSPNSLFAAGEAGDWFDPSDLSRMFTDTAGATPVTTDGQSVALILGQRRGAGTELVTNGDFSNGNTGWTEITPTFSVISGQGTLSGVNSVVDSALFNTTAGRVYMLTLNLVTSSAEMYYKARRGDTNANILDVGSSSESAGAKTFYFTAQSSTTYLRFNRAAGAGSTVFDNVSVREVALTALTQSTAANRPLYKTSGGLHWLQFDGTNDHLLGNSLASIWSGTDNASTFCAGWISSGATGTLFSVHASGTSTPLVEYATFSSTTSVVMPQKRDDASTLKNTSSSTAVNAVNVMTSSDTGILSSVRKNAVAINSVDVDVGAITLDIATVGAQRRAGVVSAPLNGNIYFLLMRGAVTTGATLNAVERFAAKKSGVTL